MSNSMSNLMSNSPEHLSNSEARFFEIEAIIEKIGYRPLARRTEGFVKPYKTLSAPHVYRVLNGQCETLVLETLKSIARAANLTLEDVIFYVERQMNAFARKNKAA